MCCVKRDVVVVIELESLIEESVSVRSEIQYSKCTVDGNKECCTSYMNQRFLGHCIVLYCSRKLPSSQDAKVVCIKHLKV